MKTPKLKFKASEHKLRLLAALLLAAAVCLASLSACDGASPSAPESGAPSQTFVEAASHESSEASASDSSETVSTSAESSEISGSDSEDNSGDSESSGTVSISAETSEISSEDNSGSRSDSGETVCISAESSEISESPAPSGFTITFLDVGQGDSAIVSCDGHNMIIDGGSASKSDLVYTVLKRMRITQLDAVVATHAHEDHVGGLSAVFELCAPAAVYCSVTEYDSKAFNNFVKQAKKRGRSITVPSSGDSFMLGSAAVTFLGPLKQYDNTNNTSIVLKISYGETSFLLTGDAERESELDLAASGIDLSATLLKVGHHGSDTSSSYPFLRAVMPKYAVISVGKNNKYGHPDEGVLSRLSDAGASVLRTDKCGDISCTSDGRTLTFRTQKSCKPEAPPHPPKPEAIPPDPPASSRESSFPVAETSRP